MIAIHWSEYEKYGCPNCGCDYSYSSIRCGNQVPATCGECKTNFLLLSDNMQQSTIGFGENSDKPIVEKHPRVGIYKHPYTKPDVKSQNGGEFWNPRGVGYDLSGFVKSKEAGERIVAMFHLALSRQPKTWLDYRPSEPDWIQVKVSNEDADLEKLYTLTKDSGVITQQIINSVVRL